MLTALNLPLVLWFLRGQHWPTYWPSQEHLEDLPDIGHIIQDALAALAEPVEVAQCATGGACGSRAARCGKKNEDRANREG